VNATAYLPSEREFQDAVADVARLAGWRVVPTGQELAA
jgi:hypothetical protein